MVIHKYAARTVIYDNEKRIAVVSVRGGDYYKIPGGKIEPGESEGEAAIREAKEEAGCEVEIIKPIGNLTIEEHSLERGERVHHSVCFLATKKKDIGVDLTQWEKDNNFEIMWLSFDEAIEKFDSIETEDEFARVINERDKKFILMTKDF